MVPHPANGFGLQHEIFVLDAYLTRGMATFKYRLVTMQLVQKLLDSLGMAELGKLQIYPAVDQRAPGWSFIQPITTSHISGHYFEKPGRLPHLRLDIYSCKNVNWKKVIEVLHQEVSLANWRATFIERDIEEGDDRMIMDITGEADVVLTEKIVSGEMSAESIEEVTKEDILESANK